MATIDDITALIAKDSKIDSTQLTNELTNIPTLVSKYFKMYVDEIRMLSKLECDSNVLYRELHEYFLGHAPDEVYAEKRLNRKLLKTDVDMYIKADQSYSIITQKITAQTAKVKMLEGFIKEIQNRNFLIKNIIENEKFKNGGF